MSATPRGRFYRADPRDPDAPVLLAHFDGPHGRIAPGDRVTYDGPPPALPGEHTVTEIWSFAPDWTAVILNDGELEVTAWHLRRVEPGPDDPGEQPREPEHGARDDTGPDSTEQDDPHHCYLPGDPGTCPRR